MKRIVLLCMAMAISIGSLFGQGKEITVLVTKQDIPKDVNTKPLVDAFMGELRRSGYPVVDRTPEVLGSIDKELTFEALNSDLNDILANSTLAMIAKYVCNIDISFVPYEDNTQQYYFSAHMVDKENTNAECVVYYPKNRKQPPITNLSLDNIQLVAFSLIQDLDAQLHFLDAAQGSEIVGNIAGIGDAKAERIQKVEDEYNNMKARAFVPGFAQIKDGAAGMGITIITGETVCIGGIAVSQYLRGLYTSKINSTHSASEKQRYAQMANVCNVATYVSIAGAAGLYVWNVVDGLSRAKQWKVNELKRRGLVIAPYSTQDFYGISLAYTF